MSLDIQPSSKRLVSLDAFRGAAIVGMVLVNCPGSYGHVYKQLQHAEWNGWTFADTIFPCFLFIVGVSITLSFAHRRERGDSYSQLSRQVVKRSIILFALGLFLNLFPIFHISTMRIPGVLQRIAVCYLFASLVMLNTSIKAHVCWTAGLLLSYWMLMKFVPVPEIGAGVYLPGNNFAAYVDSLFLTNHMWSGTETWDPEGVISTLPAIASTLFGVLTGHWLLSIHSNVKKIFGMLGGGIILLLLGQIFNIWLPINKPIWTSSFAVFMAGLALGSFSMFYWLIDVHGYQRLAKPFVVYGMNAITAYVLSEVIDRSLVFIRLSRQDGSTTSLREVLFRRFFRPLADPETASLLYAICFVLLIYVVVWTMWKKQLFLKV